MFGKIVWGEIVQLRKCRGGTVWAGGVPGKKVRENVRERRGECLAPHAELGVSICTGYDLWRNG